ncbi:MAG: hypothetical protein JO293_04800 [Candidatus Eremiobacteraeota bacterium]|nr:hypothetical protein [Candidatus Eremiobacteraeota bacterium]
MGRRKTGPPKRGVAATPEDLMQFYLRNRETFEKRTDADIERSCSSKDAYPSEAHARAVAAMNRRGDVLYTYECFYCRQWHLTRRPTAPDRGPQIIEE